MASDCDTGRPRKKGFLTRNYVLLWQGQFVSMVGEVAYQIALGFWVLAVTGSTALMGILMAAAVIPRVLLGPFLGVWVDRLDRKWVLVFVDLARGVMVLFVGVIAVLGALKIWMVFAAGVLMGVGGAFFYPAVMSVLPDLVAKQDLVRANSGLSMIRAASGILGNSAAGFVYALLGAPILFLVNGVAYVVSAIASFFMKVPKIIHANPEMHFWGDLKEGIYFVWHHRALRLLFIIISAISFFTSMGFMLILPLFQRTPELGPGRYGITMALFTLGLFLGVIVVGAIKVSAKTRFTIFMIAGPVANSAWMFFALAHSFPLMLALMFVGGFTCSILNVYVDTMTQMAIPQAMRGKAFGLLGTLAGGLTPIAMAVGGAVAELLPIRLLIAGCFACIVLIMLTSLLATDFRKTLQAEPASAEALVEEQPEAGALG